MKVYIDVSNLLLVDFVTGIQRVVREVVVRMIKTPNLEVVLLSCPKGQEIFHVLDNDNFFNYFAYNIGEKRQIISGTTCRVADLEAGAVFFDIDSVWSSHLRRSSLLPALKSNGLKLAVFIHDIIPVTYPQYCHENTTFFFLNYLAAYLQYSDLIITSTQSTLDQINALSDQLEVPRIKGYVTWLGADFATKESQKSSVSADAVSVSQKGKYILSVGTIEPRKNHKVLLDAFDEKLSSLGINLVFAGRFGWNVEDLKRRIENHPLKDKSFFHLIGQNDASIDFLYRNAYMVAFPTFDEGFGLPMIEAIERNCLMIASEIPVLKEVGGDFCDYFNPNSTSSLIQIVENYLSDPKLYDDKKRHLREYTPVTWDTVTSRMVDALKTMECKLTIPHPLIKQMVILSARVDMLLSTLPFVEKFMCFIKEVVICCPDKAVKKITSKYKGRLKLTFLTDSEILNGSSLPQDHTTRNMFLRSMAMNNPKLDNTFIMSDDDYRPLKEIKISDYYNDGQYISYYCFNLEDWTGTAWEPTSFDHGMKKTAGFLTENHYPTKHYASHMPQIINKRIYLEMLSKHPGMERKGFCEWCTYFNYLQYHYPSMVTPVPYKSMCWPGNPTDWKLQVIPTEYLFENFYEENYQKGGIFEEFSSEFNEKVDIDNVRKINKFNGRQNIYQGYQEAFEIYEKIYEYEYRESPRIGILLNKDEKPVFVMPKFLVVKKGGFVRIPFELRIIDYHNCPDELKISSFYSDTAGNTFYHAADLKIAAENSKFDFPIYGYKSMGDYFYNIKITGGIFEVQRSVPVSIIE